MRQKTYCFIDETGNKSLGTEKNGTSKYFVLASVLVKSESLDEAKSEAERIRKSFFQKGEMKSSGVSGNVNRRKKILARISGLPIQIVILAVNKELISKDSGLVWQKSFFKYSNNILSSKLLFAFSPIEIWQDEHGYKSFMDEFRNYLERKFVERHGNPNLFHGTPDADYSLNFDSSKNNCMIQVADMISGSYWRILEGVEDEAFADYFHRIFEKSILYIDQWPPDYRRIRKDVQTLPENPSLNESLEYYCVRKANLFVNEESDAADIENENLRKAFVRFLLYRLESNPKSDFVLTKVILRFLNAVSVKTIGTQFLRTNIIGKVRDKGIIIASSPKGYKIPVSIEDVHSFISHANNVIPPMVARVKDANTQVKTISFGSESILEREEFTQLRKIVDSLDR